MSDMRDFNELMSQIGLSDRYQEKTLSDLKKYNLSVSDPEATRVIISNQMIQAGSSLSSKMITSINEAVKSISDISAKKIYELEMQNEKAKNEVSASISKAMTEKTEKALIAIAQQQQKQSLFFYGAISAFIILLAFFFGMRINLNYTSGYLPEYLDWTIALIAGMILPKLIHQFNNHEDE